MTNLLKREDLFSLEEYAEQRSNIRKNVMNVKKLREVNLGEHIRLLFENHQTVQYQIQEMLRIEKIFEADGIQDELDVYNPLIPDGSNLKATMMIEYTDVVERTKALSNLIGIALIIFGAFLFYRYFWTTPMMPMSDMAMDCMKMGNMDMKNMDMNK